MQAKIPQDVQREDKIIGPFTLRQFLYLLTAAMVGYLIFSIFSRLTKNVGIGIILGLLFFSLIGAFAVIEIQGKSLSEFTLAFILFNLKPRKRVWQKDNFIPDIAFIPPKKEGGKTLSQDPSQIKSELEKLAHILDTRGWGELAEKEEKEEIEEMYKKIEKEIPSSVSETIPQKTKLPKVKKEEKISIFSKEEYVPKEEHKKEIIKEGFIKTEKEIKKEIKKREIAQKENINKLKNTINQIEKIIIEKPAITPKLFEKKAILKKKKKILPKIISITSPIIEPPEEKKPYIEEYKIALQGRLTTPRISKPTTNIKINEKELEDVLESSEKIKTIEKELKEVEEALKKQKLRKKPRIIKEDEGLAF